VFSLKKFVTIIPDQRNNRSLWGVAWMCFFWSTSSLMVFSLLPAFLMEVLGASHTKLGLLEGVAIFLAFASKVFSGILSDILKNRLSLIALGSFFSILVKLMFAAAASFSWIFVARSIDRLSKGIRSSPTDALIADLSPLSFRGTSYGLRQTLYTLGAVFGAALSTILMYTTEGNYRLIFYMSTIPAALALFILLFFIKQPKDTFLSEAKKTSLDWNIKDIRHLPKPFWQILGIATLLMLARFSEAFLTLRSKSVGWPVELLPMMIVLMDLVHAGTAFPLGKLADKKNRHKILLVGLLTLVVTNIILALSTSLVGVIIGIILVGVHMGSTQGLIAMLISETIPSHLRGTAFALFYLTSGVAVLIGNYIAGHLADNYGISFTFLGGMVFTGISILALLVVTRSNNKLAYEG
jgi:MFS family permease